jgi:tRNA(Leu) C34 or U34 (ribose-2'-O)-methylase TrmL
MKQRTANALQIVGAIGIATAAGIVLYEALRQVHNW